MCSLIVWCILLFDIKCRFISFDDIEQRMIGSFDGAQYACVQTYRRISLQLPLSAYLGTCVSIVLN